ncbi:hypothetical protein D3C75_969210 [compost metagenome]
MVLHLLFELAPLHLALQQWLTYRVDRLHELIVDIGLVLRHEVITNAWKPAQLGVAIGREEPRPTLDCQRRVEAPVGLLGLSVGGLAQAGHQVQLGFFLQPIGDRAAVWLALGVAVGRVRRTRFLDVLLGAKEHGDLAVMAERIIVFEDRAECCLAHRPT